jgi:hypothetical protein
MHGTFAGIITNGLIKGAKHLANSILLGLHVFFSLTSGPLDAQVDTLQISGVATVLLSSANMHNDSGVLAGRGGYLHLGSVAFEK